LRSRIYADDLEVVAGKASKRPCATPDVGDRAGAVLDRRSGPVERVTGSWTETGATNRGTSEAGPGHGCGVDSAIKPAVGAPRA